jgi:hypothetical protein
VDTILGLNLGMICATCFLIVFIFLVYLYCPIEQSVAINTWTIGWSVGICFVTEHLSLKNSNGLSVAINIEGNRPSVSKGIVCH